MPLVKTEVRCCCVPGKLLGHLEVEEYTLSHSQLIVPVWDTAGLWRMELNIATFDPGHGSDWYRAIQAHETQLPYLRKLRGFTEAADDGERHIP